jgi:hypothetical protein
MAGCIIFTESSSVVLCNGSSLDSDMFVLSYQTLWPRMYKQIWDQAKIKIKMTLLVNCTQGPTDMSLLPLTNPSEGNTDMYRFWSSTVTLGVRGAVVERG